MKGLHTHRVSAITSIVFTGTEKDCQGWAKENLKDYGALSVAAMTQEEIKIHNQIQLDEAKEACFEACKGINPHDPIKAATEYANMLKTLQELYSAIDSCIDLTPELLIKAKSAIDAATK